MMGQGFGAAVGETMLAGLIVLGIIIFGVGLVVGAIAL
jgi:hypothetical protein